MKNAPVLLGGDSALHSALEIGRGVRLGEERSREPFGLRGWESYLNGKESRPLGVRGESFGVARLGKGVCIELHISSVLWLSIQLPPFSVYLAFAFYFSPCFEDLDVKIQVGNLDC